MPSASPRPPRGSARSNSTATPQSRARLYSIRLPRRQAALDYLAAQGVTGSVTVEGDVVRVSVTTTADLRLLSLVGGGSATFDATAEAQAIKVDPP